MLISSTPRKKTSEKRRSADAASGSFAASKPLWNRDLPAPQAYRRPVSDEGSRITPGNADISREVARTGGIDENRQGRPTVRNRARTREVQDQRIGAETAAAVVTRPRDDLKNHHANRRRTTGRSILLVGASIGVIASWLSGEVIAQTQGEGAVAQGCPAVPERFGRRFQHESECGVAFVERTRRDASNLQDASPSAPAGDRGPSRDPGRALAGDGTAAADVKPRVLTLSRDTTGLVPGRPPGPVARRSNADVAKDVDELVELVKEPEAEIAVVVGDSKMMQTRRTLMRVLIASNT